QDAAYAVESIDISVATKRYVTFGFNYRIVKANSRYELFQVRSFVLPSADFSNFEFFATLDSFFVANKSEFFKKLTTGFFDQNISRAGLDRTNIERFYGVRLLEKINNINSTDTMFVDSIDSKSINELYLALSDIKTQDEISSVIDRSVIDKNWITDKT